MEKLNIKSTRGQARVVGPLLCIAGSLIFTFRKGGHLFEGSVERPLINAFNSESRHGKENQIKGSALLLTSHIAWTSWLLMLAVVAKVYPAPLSLTTIICFLASLQSSFLALFFARNPALWRLEWNLRLLTIMYCGVIISGLVYYLQAWCISYKGPVFAAMFSPQQVIIVGMFSAVAFAERLQLGCLIGALLIIVSLYSVLWGKKKDGHAAEPTQDGNHLRNDDKVLLA